MAIIFLTISRDIFRNVLARYSDYSNTLIDQVDILALLYWYIPLNDLCQERKANIV